MSLAQRPGNRITPKTSAESASQLRARFNPKHSVRRTRRRACAATRGIRPEMSAYDGALVAPQRIGARHRADSDSPKTRYIRAARKSRDTEDQEL